MGSGNITAPAGNPCILTVVNEHLAQITLDFSGRNVVVYAFCVLGNKNYTYQRLDQSFKMNCQTVIFYIGSTQPQANVAKMIWSEA